MNKSILDSLKAVKVNCLFSVDKGCDNSIDLLKLSIIVLYLSISIALLAACAFQKRSRPQQLTLYRSLHAEALQATVSEGLAQGPYLAARAGFEPTKGIVSTNAPPSPTNPLNGF